MEYYRQCILEKGTTHTTAWIEERYAVEGKQVKMELPNGSWDNGWTVTSVWQTRKEENIAKADAHNSDKIWKATSGSAPRGNK